MDPVVFSVMYKLLSLHGVEILNKKKKHIQAIQNRAQRVRIGRRTNLVGFASGLFGWHVAGRAQDLAGCRQTLIGFGLLRQPKIRDLGLTVFVQQNVRGFQVAMNDAFGMRVCDSLGHQFRKFRGFFRL